MAESRIDTFNRNVGLLQSLYDQLETNDRSLALDQLKNLLSNCEKKSACLEERDTAYKEYQIPVSNAEHIGLLPPTQLQVKPLKGMSVESTTEFVAKLQNELQQLREENHKLQTELNRLSPRLKECYKPDNVVKSIINDILLKVIPPDARRRVGRPRKNHPKPESDAPTVTTKPKQVQEPKPLVASPTEQVGKRKRGRPRKNLQLQDNAASPSFRPEINTSAVKRKYFEIEKALQDNSGTHPSKRMTDEVVVKKEEETKPGNQDATTGLQLRTRKPKVERSMSAGEMDDDSGIPDYLDDDSDSESELPFSFRKRHPGLAGSSRPKFNLNLGLGLTKRPRGRPRKNPIRDPSTIKKHKRIIRHVCKICNAQFLHGRPFHRHLSMRHDGGPASCLRCKKEFENHAHYLHHKCEVDTNRPERSCKHCDSKFKSFKSLQEHVQNVHGLKTIDPIYFCKYCQKGFIRRPSLVHHLRSHAEGRHVCDKCGEFSVTEEEHATHMEKHRRPSTGTMHCERCGAVFDRRQQFEQHIAAHEKYDCSICNKAFSRKKALLKHVRDIHGIKVSMEEKKHQCQVCGRTFNRPGQLEIHNRVHTGERPIECSTCKMFFKSTKALWKHRQTHTHLTKEGALPLEKDHLCAICGKSYFRKQALQRHMRYHDDSKPFKCPHCQYRCRDLNNLKRHVSLHFSSRQFVCEICGSSFHAKKTLETHTLYKHSNDRMHSCPECPMTFKTPNSLRRHKVIHATVRPFKCQSCNMGFNRLYNLRRHMKGIHGSDESLPSVNRVKVIDVPQSQQYLKGMTIQSKQSEAISQAEFFSKQTEPKSFLLKEEEDGMSTPPRHPVDGADLLPRPPVPLSIPHILGHPPSTSHMFLPAQVAAYSGENTGGLDMPSDSQTMTITPLSALHMPGPYINQPAGGYLTIAPSTSPSPSPHLQPPALASHPHHLHPPQQHQQQQPQQQEQQPEQQEQHQIVVTQSGEDGLQRITYTTEMYSPVGSILHLMNNAN